MPGFQQALSDERIEKLVVYLKQLVDTSRYPPGDLNFLRPVLTIVAFPEDEGLIINRFIRGKEGEPDAVRTILYYGRRFGARYQAEVELAHINPESESSSLDILELGFEWAMHDSLESQTLATLGVEAAIPLEDDDESLNLLPYFSLAQGISDSVTFQGTLIARLPTDGIDQGSARLSSVFHWMPSVWKCRSPTSNTTIGSTPSCSGTSPTAHSGAVASLGRVAARTSL